jgi:hypothetical protein
VNERRPEKLLFQVLWFSGAPRARPPWAGPRAAALGIGRLGLAAALRAGGGSVGGGSVGGPAFGGPRGGGAVPGFGRRRFSGADSRRARGRGDADSLESDLDPAPASGRRGERR